MATSSFVANLERALIADAREEIKLTMKVGLLLAAGHPRRTIAERLDLTPAELNAAIATLKRVAPELTRYGGGNLSP